MQEPSCIKKLDEVVVNRIAAGEVIQRPCNAIKELLENSLDAKSTNIQVTLKDGGLKLLQIQDNGTGIRKEDLDIVCERFTTSKLKTFEDLSTIATFGFRGEALASISHVAHLTITTKTVAQQCAFKASYEDGKLKGPPKACAGNQGTQITVEDLFYNVPTRKRALKNPNEEYAKVSEVICRYAVHNPEVGFTLKKQGDTTSAVKTNPNSTHVENIRCIYGDSIAKEIVEVECSDDVLQFKMHGFVSNANFSTKKQIFILFINDRLVDSSALKKSLEKLYSFDLPNGNHPFIYLDLQIDPRNVDVNVHPTKHEVHFLHEDAIIESTRLAVEKKLLGCNTSRVFYTQAKLPGIDVNLTNAVLEKSVETKPTKPMYLVRTDSTSQKIQKFFPSVSKETTEPQTQTIERRNDYVKRNIKLTSVLTLRKEIENNCCVALRDIIADSIFVGCSDENTTLIQHSTKLYLFNSKRLKQELFYQLILYDFGNLGAIKFETPLPLYDLAMLGLDDPEAGWKEELGAKKDLAKKVEEVLFSKREMLVDYFSIEIDENRHLCAVPLILEKYTPDVSRLPCFLLRLACDVDWSAEKPCFSGIAEEIAKFFSHTHTIDGKGKWEWTEEHVILPALKKTLLPPTVMANDETFIEIACLPDLYRVFERC